MASGAERQLLSLILGAHLVALLLGSVPWSRGRAGAIRLVEPYLAFSGQKTRFSSPPTRWAYRASVTVRGTDGGEKTVSGGRLPERLRRILVEAARQERYGEDLEPIVRHVAARAFPGYAVRDFLVRVERALVPTGSYLPLRLIRVGGPKGIEVGERDGSAVVTP